LINEAEESDDDRENKKNKQDLKNNRSKVVRDNNRPTKKVREDIERQVFK